MSGKGSRLEEARPGNIIGKVADMGGNAASEYYSFMVRNEKLNAAKASKVISAGELAAINSLGDLEKWELKALARLYKLGDNSPELLQYLHIMQCSTREEVAKKLAQKQYRKQMVENALNKLLSPTEVATSVKATQDSSRANIALNAFGIPAE